MKLLLLPQDLSVSPEIKDAESLLLFFYKLVTQRTKSTSVSSAQNVAFINKKKFYCYSSCLSNASLKRSCIMAFSYELTCTTERMCVKTQDRH